MVRVRAKLVKYAMCECGLPAIWEHVPLGKIYTAYPETIVEMPWQCRCGKEHTSKMIEVDDGIKPIGTLFVDLFEFDEGIAE